MKGEMRIRRLLKQVTYKPGYVMTLTRRQDCLNFGIFVETTDSDDPSKKLVVTTFFCITPEWAETQTDTQILGWFMKWLAGYELHEVLEWFKIDGKHAIPPHPNGWLYGEYDRKTFNDFGAMVFEELENAGSKASSRGRGKATPKR